MEKLHGNVELRNWRRQQQQRVALVPTMGNLHDGHLELVREARQQADIVVVSIFVNPMQFGANEDLDSYPRTLEHDCKLLEQLGVQAVFMPTVADVYPRGLEMQTRVEVPEIGGILCGASRPGHFVGVATIVCKLFNMVQPDVAIFGQKDFQQLQIIRLMTQDLSIPTTIVGVPTRRENDGLAMSSRNSYLDSHQRFQAATIYQTLKQIKARLSQPSINFKRFCDEGEQQLEAAGFEVDYVSIRNAEDLQPATTTDSQWVILIAARLGDTRLIDNLTVMNNHT